MKNRHRVSIRRVKSSITAGMSLLLLAACSNPIVHLGSDLSASGNVSNTDTAEESSTDTGDAITSDSDTVFFSNSDNENDDRDRDSDSDSDSDSDRDRDSAIDTGSDSDRNHGSRDTDMIHGPLGTDTAHGPFDSAFFDSDEFADSDIPVRDTDDSGARPSLPSPGGKYRPEIPDDGLGLGSD